MKRVLIITTLILFCASVGLAQKSVSQTVLEVRESSFGVVASAGDYLFLKVFDDCQVEYEKDLFENNTHKLVLHKYKLSSVQLENLMTFLNSSEITNIASDYEPDVPTIDRVIAFDISITRNSQTQSIKLTNYYPSRPKSKDKYPAKLIELVCRIKALRYNSTFRLLGNDCLLK